MEDRPCREGAGAAWRQQGRLQRSSRGESAASSCLRHGHATSWRGASRIAAWQATAARPGGMHRHEWTARLGHCRALLPSAQQPSGSRACRRRFCAAADCCVSHTAPPRLPAARKAKAEAVAPRPVAGLLRPVVHGQVRLSSLLTCHCMLARVCRCLACPACALPAPIAGCLQASKQHECLLAKCHVFI